MAARLATQSATLYRPDHIHHELIRDGEATKATILGRIDAVAQKIKPYNHFILFVAGHGVLLQNQYYMLTHDYAGRPEEANMISSNEIVEMSKRIKSLNQLLIFDTCHAGGVDYIVSGLYDARMSVLARKMGIHIDASASDKEATMDGVSPGLFRDLPKACTSSASPLPSRYLHGKARKDSILSIFRRSSVKRIDEARELQSL